MIGTIVYYAWPILLILIGASEVVEEAVEAVSETVEAAVEGVSNVVDSIKDAITGEDDDK